MNKKLFEYREKVGQANLPPSVAVRYGFDQAIKLDLAVKFARWKDENVAWHDKHTLLVDGEEEKIYKFNGVLWDLSVLYDYWVDNILKLE